MKIHIYACISDEDGESLPRFIRSLNEEEWAAYRLNGWPSILQWGHVHPRVSPPIPLYDQLRGLVVRLRGILAGRGDRYAISKRRLERKSTPALDTGDPPA